MAEAKKGDTVKVHYQGTFDDGTVFDASVDREPLQFVIGEGSLIPGFENAIVGMNPGEKKTEKIPADEAYGPHFKELLISVDKKQLPPDLEPQIGQQLQINQEEGKTTIVTISEITEESVTLDANHPLAGKDLTFELELVDVV